jgi:hypothetical protein
MGDFINVWIWMTLRKWKLSLLMIVVNIAPIQRWYWRIVKGVAQTVTIMIYQKQWMFFTLCDLFMEKAVGGLS